MLPLATEDLTPVLAPRPGPADVALAERLVASPDGGGWFWIEVRKVALGTGRAAAALARAAGVPRRLVRHAGQRDRHAVCRQWLTIPREAVDNPKAIAGAGCHRQLEVVDVRDGDHPIEAEDVDGMAVELVLAPADPEQAYPRARALIDRLRRAGGPNYFAAETYGADGTLAGWGFRLLRGKRLPDRVARATGGARRCLQAARARLFDGFLAYRSARVPLDRCLAGDVVRCGLNRPPALRETETVIDPAAVQARIDAREAKIMAPLFGRGCRPAARAARDLEDAFLAEVGWERSNLERLRGGRRPACFHPQAVACLVEDDRLLIRCHLPCDASVDVLLGELLHDRAEELGDDD